jgi:hypothetical protein
MAEEGLFRGRLNPGGLPDLAIAEKNFICLDA